MWTSGTQPLDKGCVNMKKLLLLAPLLAWSGVATAQQSEAEADQSTDATRPVIERVDISAGEQPSETTTLLQVAILASRPDGGSLNYDFRGQDGAISGNGSNASWTVTGAGPFNATVEVTVPGSACTAFAYLTYSAAEAGSDTTGEGEEAAGVGE
jgi:hypothetical protein